MVVETLRHQLERQRVRPAARLLQLGALVLEPDLDLRLVQLELGSEAPPTLLGQVRAGVELAPEPVQLRAAVERKTCATADLHTADAADVTFLFSFEHTRTHTHTRLTGLPG